MRAVDVGHHVVGFDVSVDRVKRLCAGESFVEDVSSETVRGALASGRYQPTDSPLDCEGFDVAVISVPTPLDEGRPDLSYVESAAQALAPYVTRRVPRRAGVDELPRHHRVAARAVPRVGIRAARRRRLLGRLQPRADRPGQRDVDPGDHAEAGLRRRRSARWSGPRFYRTLVAETVPARDDEGRRAGQAAGEHLPPRQHRAGQRARDGRLRPRHRRVGGHRRGRDEAVRVHEVRAGAGRGRALPADRPVLPVVDRPPPPRPRVPVRRARQRHQRPHARLRAHAARRGAQPARTRAVRRPRAAARAGLQAQLLRRPRVARSPARAPARRRRRASDRRRPARRRGRPAGHRRTPGRRRRRPSWRPRTPWCW